MKVKLIFLLACYAVFMSGCSYGSGFTYYYSESGFTNGCGRTGNGCGARSYCVREYACDCNCADFGYRYNYCVDRSTYCRAFGNIGNLD